MGSLIQPNSMLSTAGGPSFIGSPQQALSMANKTGIPAAAQDSGLQGAAMVGRMLPQSGVDQSSPTPNLPFLSTPSTSQVASSGPLGQPNMGALTKGGKLLSILKSGLEGALAGRAAEEQSIVQSGGHTRGGFGTGAEAGFTLPFLRAQQRSQAQLAQAGLQPIETPYGQMPAALAGKILTPYLGYQGRIGAAEIGAGAKTEAAKTEAGAKVQAEQIGKRFINVPGVGLYDTAQTDAKGGPHLIPDTEQGIVITPEIADQYQLPAQYVGKPMKLGDLAQMERAQSYQNVVAQGANGPALVNRNQASPNFGKATSLGIGSPALGRAVMIADPNNPGNVTYSTAGKAIASGASSPQSAQTQAAKKAAVSEVPSKIGDQRVAFSTALQHANLLESAIRSMNNGDQQTLNSLSNRFKNEFGASGPITAQTIAQAYTREVNKMLSGGHITDAEINSIGKTLDPQKQNPQQIEAVLSSYRALAQSKLNQLDQQKQRAIGGNSGPKILREGVDF